MPYATVEATREAGRIYRAANKERIAERKLAWKRANRGRLNAAQRAAYAANPEAKRAYNKAWCAANKDRRRAIARASYHKNKRRDKHLMQVFGMTAEQWDAMFEGQGRACRICRASEPGGRGVWHTDHCHTTRKVRGILCHYCNVGLGNFKDDPALLGAAIGYLAG